MSPCKDGKCGQRREPLNMVYGPNVVKELYKIMTTGVIPAGFAASRELAVIANSLREYWHQKQKPAGDAVTLVDIQFGPEKQYTLRIPVKGPVAKRELAGSLRAIADRLDSEAT